MNFRQLEYLHEIAKEGTVSGAAKKLFISQSALSQQLLRLEEEIGAPIFERGFSRLKPTHFGELYLERTKKILLEYLETQRLLQDMEDLEVGRVIVGLPPNRAIQLLPTFFPRFLTEHPKVELKIVEAVSYRLDEMIMDGEIDFSIMVSRPSSPAFAFEELMQEEIFLAVPDNRTFTLRGPEGKQYADLEDFRDERFVLMEKGHRLRGVSDRLFLEKEIKPQVLMETGNVDLARRIAAEGGGICFCSELASVFDPLKHAPLYYPVGEEGIFWELGVVYHREKYISKAMRLFINEVKNELMNRYLPK